MESYQIFGVIYVVEAWFYLDELVAGSQGKESKIFNIYSPSSSKGLAWRKDIVCFKSQYRKSKNKKEIAFL